MEDENGPLISKIFGLVGSALGATLILPCRWTPKYALTVHLLWAEHEIGALLPPKPGYSARRRR